MNLPASQNRTLRTIYLVCLLLVSAFLHSGLRAQAVLNPGQFSGRVQIGNRPILSASFLAVSTSPTGFSSSVGLNGTMWNQTYQDFRGPLDPNGFTLSAEALDPNDALHPPILYDILGLGVVTQGSHGGTDQLFFVNYPLTTNKFVTPNGITHVDFIEPNPAILTVEVVNMGCQQATIAPDVVASRPGTYGDYTFSADSEPTEYYPDPGDLTRSYHSRTMDFPILSSLGPYLVTPNVRLGGATQSRITPQGQWTEFPLPNLTPFVRFFVYPVCPCTTGTLTGEFDLSGALPSGVDLYHTIRIVTDTIGADKILDSPPDNYAFTGLGDGHYHFYPGTQFNAAPSGLAKSTLIWPWSTFVGVDGWSDPLPGTGNDKPYVNLACGNFPNCIDDQKTVNFVSPVASLEGNITYACFPDFKSRVVAYQQIYAYPLDGRLPDKTPIGTYGGTSLAYTYPQLGDLSYRHILTPGHWTESAHGAHLDITNPDRADHDYGDFVNEGFAVSDNRTDAINLGSGETWHQDFSYEMGKYTVLFTIDGGLGDGSRLRSPRLDFVGFSGTTDYYAYAEGSGELFHYDPYPTLVPGPDTNGNGDIGRVTLFLPKGDYNFRPYAVRASDGSQASFPVVFVHTACGVSTTCATGAPTAQWLPEANTCLDSGTVSGTAIDSDGFDRISYRLYTPGENPLPPMIDLALNLIPPNGVSFSAPITPVPGQDYVDLEMVDALGNTCFETRPIRRFDGIEPDLDWPLSSPTNNITTCQRFVDVAGSVSSSANIASLTIHGVPYIGSSDQHNRAFNKQVPLSHGPNLITVEVCDVCGHCKSETRSVTQNCLPSCDADPAPSCPAVPGEQRTRHFTGGDSTDPDPEDLATLAYSWTTDCTNAGFDNSSNQMSGLMTPSLTVGLQDTCPATCRVSLTVTDSLLASSTNDCHFTLPIGTNSPQGLVGWWPGDGDAHDIARGNDGTPTNVVGFTTGGNGLVGEAFSFNGTSDFVVLPDAPELDFGPVASGGSNLSISAWVRTTLNATSGVQVIIDKRRLPSYQGYELFLYEDRLGLQLASGGSYTNYLAPTSSALTPDCWHHVAISIDRQSTTGGMFYVDGNSVLPAAFDASTYDGDLSNSAGPRIGATLDAPLTSPSALFSGQIDELQIFNTTLALSDVQAMVASRSFGQCRCVAPPSGLVSWWTGDGTASDIQGGNDGELRNGATYTSGPGARVGQAFTFNGSTDYVLIPDSPTLDPGTGSFSIDAWVTPESTGQAQAIVSKYECGAPPCGNSHYLLYVHSDGHAAFYVRDTNGGGPATGGEEIFGGPVLWTGGPYLVVGTRDMTLGTLNLYVNGSRVAGQGMPGEDPFGPGASDAIKDDDGEPDHLRIGASTTEPPDYEHIYFKGAIDEVEYFNKALTPTEVNAMYAARGRGKCKPGCDPRPSGLVSWWSGDGHASDIQGGNDGAFVGTPVYTSGPNDHVGKAFDFDGTSSYVSVPHNSNLEPRTGSFSVDAWVYTKKTAGSQTVVEKYDGGGAYDGNSKYVLSLQGGVPTFEIRDAIPAPTTPHSGQSIQGKPFPTWTAKDGWHLLVATREIPDLQNPRTGMMKLYVDGLPAASASLECFESDCDAEGDITEGTTELDPLTIGAGRQSLSDGTGPVRFFYGFIDEVEYFNRALSQSEVENMYNAGSRGKCKPQSCSDIDGDSYGAPASLLCPGGSQHGDCAPKDPDTWAVPGEVQGLTFVAQDTLGWQPPADRGGTTNVVLRYDVLRSSSGDNFSSATKCVSSDQTPETAFDTEQPQLQGEAFFYLVRAENACLSAQWNLGIDLDHTVRLGRTCP